MATTRKPRRVLRKLVLVLLLLLFGISALAGIFLVEGGLRPPRRLISGENELRALAETQGVQWEDVELRAADGVLLRAWLLFAARTRGNSADGPPQAVMLFHGVADSRNSMLGYARLFLRNGYAVLIPDARAHGASGGDLATFGVLESADARGWARWFRTRTGAPCVHGLGESMGGAILLQALAAEESGPSESVFCSAVAESPFADFREIAFDRVGQHIGLGPWFGRYMFRIPIEFGWLYARWKYGLDLGRASPVCAVASTRVPILLIHGARDDNIPHRHSAQLRAAAPAIEYWEPPDTTHTGTLSNHPAEFERRVIAWFRQHSRSAR